MHQERKCLKFARAQDASFVIDGSTISVTCGSAKSLLFCQIIPLRVFSSSIYLTVFSYKFLTMFSNSFGDDCWPVKGKKTAMETYLERNETKVGTK